MTQNFDEKNDEDRLPDWAYEPSPNLKLNQKPYNQHMAPFASVSEDDFEGSDGLVLGTIVVLSIIAFIVGVFLGFTSHQMIRGSNDLEISRAIAAGFAEAACIQVYGTWTGELSGCVYNDVP